MSDLALPMISVVTPSFNQGRFLEETILNVHEQRYPFLDHIIIDGGSSDNSVEIIRKHQDKFAYWVSEKDSGQTNAINKGFCRARGEIIAWLNSDDRYCEGALNIVGRHFAQHPDCMWMAGNVLFTHEEGEVFARKKPFYSAFILRYGSASLYQPGVFIRRKVLETCGFPREDFHAIMDREWFCRIAAQYPPQLVDQDLALFRWHPESKSSSAKTTPHFRRYYQECLIVCGEKSRFLRAILRIAPRPSVWSLEQLSRALKVLERVRRLLFPASEGLL